jgi:ferredoxin
MQALYDTLRSLGVRDIRIFAEAFGPASLKRFPDEGALPARLEDEAEEAVVSFTKSNIEKLWNRGDATLLELAEDQGLNPDFGCRKGSCGMCLTKLKSGSITYRTKPGAEHASDEVLICCAVPAEGSERVELEL